MHSLGPWFRRGVLLLALLVSPLVFAQLPAEGGILVARPPNIAAFSAVDGSLIATNFLSNGAMAEPRRAILNNEGTEYLVLDRENTGFKIHRFSLAGNYLGLLFDSATLTAASNPEGLVFNNVFDMAQLPNGDLLVSQVAQDGTVIRIDSSDNVSDFFESGPGGGGVIFPFGILVRETDVLVGWAGRNNDVTTNGIIRRYGIADGALQGNLTTAVSNPTYITQNPNGNLLVGFADPDRRGETNREFLSEYSATGAQVAGSPYELKTPRFGPNAPLAIYGSAPLTNGQILFAANGVVAIFDPSATDPILATEILSTRNAFGVTLVPGTGTGTGVIYQDGFES